MDQNQRKKPGLEARLRAKSDEVFRALLTLHKRAPETRVASSLSPIELMVALYYGGVLRHNPRTPLDPERDRFVISKGHGSLCLYPILADLGYFPKEELDRAGLPGSFLGGIPDPVIPGYETLNGSLGHGPGVGAGMALALRRKGALRQKGGDQRVFVLTGDGELHEGSVWEAFMFAGHHKLENLIILVDNNQQSMLGHTNDILSLGDLRAKFKSFGFAVRLVEDGHDPVKLCRAFKYVRSHPQGKPWVVICNTRKGHRVARLEGAPLSHVTAVPADEIDAILNQEAV